MWSRQKGMITGSCRGGMKNEDFGRELQGKETKIPARSYTNIHRAVCFCNPFGEKSIILVNFQEWLLAVG